MRKTKNIGAGWPADCDTAAEQAEHCRRIAGTYPRYHIEREKILKQAEEICGNIKKNKNRV